MKVGVFAVLYQSLPFEAALDKLASMGAEAVEIGTGNYPGDGHCRPAELIADHDAARRFKDAVTSRGLTISALSQHGNPLHPDAGYARAAHETWRATVRLAELLEIPVVCAFSGCPGDHEGARYPNWVTCPWPDDYLKILEWQWTEKVIPYWTEEARFAEEHGINIGVLDTKHYGRVVDRSWVFRTVGYGQGEKTWRDIISALRAVNYDYVLSIEHEDSLMSIDEGLQKGLDLLKSITFREEQAQMWLA